MLKRIWYFLCSSLFLLLPDRLFFNLTFFITCIRLGRTYYWLNVSHPVSFNEKLNFLKLTRNTPLGTIVADKYAVREYVRSKWGDSILIPLLGVYDNADSIPFHELPDQFVLKANHGSGWNIICTDKNTLDKYKVRKKLHSWLKMNAYFLSREPQYRNITPKIVCEVMLGSNILDYKIFCSAGQPFMIQVDVDRFTNHKRSFYDLNWNRQNFGIRYPVFEGSIPKPESLDEMIDVAKSLCADFSFSRIDLYLVHGKVYFGEITLFPGGGNEPFLSTDQDFEFGRFIHLN